MDHIDESPQPLTYLVFNHNTYILLIYCPALFQSISHEEEVHHVPCNYNDTVGGTHFSPLHSTHFRVHIYAFQLLAGKPVVTESNISTGEQ